MAERINKNVEFVDQNQEKKDYKKARFKDVLDGSLLTRDNVVGQLPFVLFLTLLLVIYIGNRYHAERVIRQSLRLQNELRELRARAISTASELEYMSNQTQVAKLVEQKNTGLKYSDQPPIKIDSRRIKKRR